MRFVAFVVCLVAARTAIADDAATLQATGEELARNGRYSEAIEAFKAADRVDPHASHACLIALAYTRRELWPQAEIFMDLCHRRATATDPLPDWVPAADAQIAERLATVNVAAVELHTVPTEVGVALSVSDFLPDEMFAPRTIHLAFGHHVVTVTGSSRFETAKVEIDVADRNPKRVVIELHIRPEHPPRTVPWTLIGAGGAITLGAVALHVFWFRPARDALANAHDGIEAAKLDSAFTTRRDVTLAAYGVGLAALVTGIVLRLTTYGDRFDLVASPERGGAVVGIEWRR